MHPDSPSNERKPDATGSLSRRDAMLGAIVTTSSVAWAWPGQVLAKGKAPDQSAGADRRERRRTSDTPLKRRAREDYRQSLIRYGGSFSNNIDNLLADSCRSDELHFGVVVVGSGYGASICAARLSQRLRPGVRICILERGREWVPGNFPDRFSDMLKETRTAIAGPTRGQVTNPLGLYNLMMNKEVNLLTGNGLGGGSLINASIALRPHHEVFQQSQWPEALRDVAILEPYYRMVARQLSLARSLPDMTPKVRARRCAANRISSEPGFFDLPNLSVMYDHRYLDENLRNPQGMIQRPCTMCGDCITGCNVGAKNTLLTTYLPVAKWNGTEFYTQCEVQRIQKCDGFYRIHGTYFDDSQPELQRRPFAINTRMVVVGAGSPASATVLMQSQDESLCMSPSLGKNWSGNGDTIGFVIKMPGPTNIAGYGAWPQGCRPPVGPTVQTSVNYYSNEQMFRRLLIQEAAIPRGAANLFTMLMGDADLNNSMVMLGMGHDGAQGQIIWRDGRWQVSWPGLKESRYRQMVFAEFERLARAHGGQYKRLKAFGSNLVSVHPLGGCGMSDDPCHGTVNHLGQVFDGAQGGRQDPQTGLPAVHPNFYVADGSVIPTALGVNPLMTIGALSERIANHIVSNPNHADLFEIRTAARR